MRVFLIHGMGRTSASMALLGRRLRAAGHTTSSFGYLVSRQDFDVIVDRWVEHIDRRLAEKPDVDSGGAQRRSAGPAGDAGVAAEKGGDLPSSKANGFAIVGHSLGNLITRKALPRLPHLERFVMLAPPNQPPALARSLERNAVFRALTQDAGRKLLDVDGFYGSLPLPTMPTLIIAGDGGPRFARTPWHGAPNDGVVGVDETRLPGIETVVVDAIHTLIMNQRDVAGLTLRFLADGPTEPTGAG